jgi:RIO-like serine/threonine protein kinase
MEHTFWNKVDSYTFLALVQGHEVPCCYGSGHIVLPNCAFFPHILLLQYIPDAANLCDITVKPDRSVILSLVKTVCAFDALGVTHNDLNPGNILFSTCNAPTHAVIIDFGHSARHQNGDSVQEWDEMVGMSADVHAFKWLLGWKG